MQPVLLLLLLLLLPLAPLAPLVVSEPMALRLEQRGSRDACPRERGSNLA
jgi:hypothetical protein